MQTILKKSCNLHKALVLQLDDHRLFRTLCSCY